jgi:hypothetical protein
MPKIETRPIFFPALSNEFSKIYEKTDKDLLGSSVNVVKNPRFYNDCKNYFYHPYTLWNAHEHILFQKIKNIRKEKRIDNKCLVMLDSGGFQLGKGSTENKKYNKEIVLKWSESNGDIFPIIDYPLMDEYNRTFEENLKLSVENGEYYKKNRTKKGVMILNVLQGRNFDESDEWHDRIKHLNKGVGALDGWAIGGVSDNPLMFIYTIRKLYKDGHFNKKKQSWIHIFGTTSFESMLYLSVIQKNLNKLCNVQISYDSATLSHTTKYGNFMEHRPNLSRFVRGELASGTVLYSDLCESIDRFRHVFLSKHFDYKFVKKDTKLPLPFSPIVSEITDAKEFCKNRKTYTLLGNLHNLWMMIQQKELFDNLVFWGDERVINESIGNELKINVNVINQIFTKKELKKKYTMKCGNILEMFSSYYSHYNDKRKI